MPSQDLIESCDLIYAAGGIIERWDHGEFKICLIHRERHGGEWSLPKGKQEAGEELWRTALREVEEETGCKVRLTGFAGVTHYYHGNRPKIVLYWRMTTPGPCDFTPSEEVQDMGWVTPSEALPLLTHTDEIALIETVYKLSH